MPDRGTSCGALDFAEEVIETSTGVLHLNAHTIRIITDMHGEASPFLPSPKCRPALDIP